MKKILIWFSVLMVCFCFYFSLSFAQGPTLSQKSVDQIVDNIVRPYLAALKNGDVKTLKTLMAKDLYEERKALIEQNTEYPDFLRRIYQDADFTISSAYAEANDILVNVVIKHSDGRENQSNLYLINENNNWKISNKPGPQ
jgi:hypothetical protein